LEETEMNTAVILAAGRGSRMGPLTSRTPKPLLPVGDRPLIEWIVGGIAAAGIEHAVVVIGYLGEQIARALGDGSRFGLRIEYRVQEETDGTARALLAAEAEASRAPFLLTWGDILVEPRLYADMADSFRRAPCDALLAVNATDDPWRGAAVYVDAEWRVTRLEEKPPRGTAMTRWNNAGVLALAPRIFEFARRLRPSARGEYELPAAVAAMVEAGCTVRAHPIRGFWSDVGTRDDLEDARRRFAPQAVPS
jgi:NDP-sugar pyrophosphorylase family protein